MIQRWRSTHVPHPSALLQMTPEVAGAVRAAARAVGAFSLVAFAFLSIYRGVPRSLEPDDWEIYLQLGTLTVLALGYAMAWRWEGIGSAILIVGGVTLGVAASVTYPPSEAVFAALAFVMPGLGFALHWQWHVGPVRLAFMAVPIVAVLASGGWTSAQVWDSYYGPTHASSSVELPREDLVEWAWSGGVTPAGFVVKARLVDEPVGPVRLRVEPAGGGEAALFEGSPVAEGGRVYEFRASGLEPGTRYAYGVEASGRLDEGRRGTVATFAKGALSFTVAVGSCMVTGSNGQVFDRILEAEPDLMIIPGDFNYENFHTTNPGDFLDAYSQNLRAPAQESLFLRTPLAYVWDDHDFGGNDSDGLSMSRGAARRAYAAFVPHYELAAGDGNAIYQAFSVGRVRFILTDSRSERRPAGVAGGPTMLGAAQRDWLERELLAARDASALIVWVNGVPWVDEAAAGADSWAGYAAEREAIANFIAENRIGNLAMISGDAHMVAIDDGSHTDYSTVEGDAAFPLLHAAALDRRGSVKGGPYSEGAYPGGGQFALMRVEDDGDTVTVRWTGMTWEGTELVSYEFSVGGAGAAAAR